MTPVLNVGIVGLGKMGLLHTGILNSINNVKILAISEKERIITKYVKISLSFVKVKKVYIFYCHLFLLSNHFLSNLLIFDNTFYECSANDKAFHSRSLFGYYSKNC